MNGLGSSAWVWCAAIPLLPKGTHLLGGASPAREFCIIPSQHAAGLLEMPRGLRDSEPGWAVQRSIWTAMGPGPQPA